MRHFLLILILGFLSFSAEAGRILPTDLRVAYIEKVKFPNVILGSARSHLVRTLSLGLLDKPILMKLSTAVRIADENNRWIVHSKLPQYKGRMIAFRLDYQKNISTMWILTPKEEISFLEKVREKPNK